jgi:hypothetical protein
MNATRAQFYKKTAGARWAVRLLLLVLLAIDWAAGPCDVALALAPLAHELGSTEVSCHSLERQAEITRVCALAPCLCRTGTPAFLPSASPLQSWPGTPCILPWPDNPSLYVFMSLQR